MAELNLKKGKVFSDKTRLNFFLGYITKQTKVGYCYVRELRTLLEGILMNVISFQKQLANPLVCLKKNRFWKTTRKTWQKERIINSTAKNTGYTEASKTVLGSRILNLKLF